MNASSQRFFLGLDFGTQALKAALLDAAGQPLAESAVSFDDDLPAYRTRGGVHRGADGRTVTAPPRMWAAALDRLLAGMRRARLPLARIAAVSGSGQQHGSVYWAAGTWRRLGALDARRPLEPQLRGAFAVEDSPVWMDTSTTAQCRARESVLGGPAAVARLTGSRAIERFTGNQIAKLYQTRPDRYAATERISLVSSFAASLLIGGYAPLEPGDASGMNLMNIRTRRWAPAALRCTAPGLARRLGPIGPSHAVIGRIASYYALRYGFNRRALVIAFTGDNPSSLAALGLADPGTVAVSLGTSDTVFGTPAAPRPSAEEGHLFGNPIRPGGCMALVCFQNGSLTREWARDRYAGGSWERFEAALAATPPGNGGAIGFHFTAPEITPRVPRPCIRRFGADDAPLRRLAPERCIRALAEGQCLAMRLHAGRLGLLPRTLVAVGGASVNRALLQVMADVFQAPVGRTDRPNAASRGAALRALHGWRCARARRFVPFEDAVPALLPPEQMKPDRRLAARYGALLRRYALLEAALTGSGAPRPRAPARG